MPNINRKKYPELDKLLWDIHCKTIEPEVAFRLYEERWAFVDAQKLSAAEKRLIKKLTNLIGKGVFMPLCA